MARAAHHHRTASPRTRSSCDVAVAPELVVLSVVGATLPTAVDWRWKPEVVVVTEVEVVANG